LAAALLAVAFAAGCNFHEDKTDATPEPTLTVDPATLGYAEVRAQVFEKHCVNCHLGSAAFGGLSLGAFATTKARADEIKARVLSASPTMPPGGAIPGDAAAVLRAWLDAGAPEKGAAAALDDELAPGLDSEVLNEGEF